MDKALKQRLVGASVLIAFAVIVLPMLLSGRSERLKHESRQIELPEKPQALSIESRRFPVGDPGKPALNADRAGSEPGAVETTAAQDPAGPATAADGPAEPAVTPAALDPGQAEGQPASGDEGQDAEAPRYLVQVASFSSEENANALAARLRAENLAVLMDVVQRETGRLHRVRVGPFTRRSEADRVVADLQARMKDAGAVPRVLDLRPADSAPVSAPADPLVRWVVQVGSFSSAEAAEELVARLRAGGLAAFAEEVSAAGVATYKVRIGPEIDRDQALELARRVRSEYQLDSFVTTRD